MKYLSVYLNAYPLPMHSLPKTGLFHKARQVARLTKAAERVQPKFPVPPLLKQSKKRKTEVEKSKTERGLIKQEVKQFNAGMAFQQRLELQELKGLKSDASISVGQVSYLVCFVHYNIMLGVSYM